MLRDKSKQAFVGNGKLGAILTGALNVTDKPMVYINSDIGQLPGEDARKRIAKQTFASTTAGAVTLKRYFVDETGTALASGIVVNVAGTEYTTGSGGVVTHALAIATYATVQAMLDGINALAGFVAVIGDALTTTPLATGKLVATTEASLPGIGIPALGVLHNDVSASNVAYLRVGLPTRKDRNPLQLIGLRGKITSATGGLVRLLSDDQADYVADASHQQEFDSFVPATSLTAHVADNVDDGATLQGPVVLVVSATAITGADYHIKYRQALV